MHTCDYRSSYCQNLTITTYYSRRTKYQRKHTQLMVGFLNIVTYLNPQITEPREMLDMVIF